VEDGGQEALELGGGEGCRVERGPGLVVVGDSDTETEQRQARVDVDLVQLVVLAGVGHWSFFVETWQTKKFSKILSVAFWFEDPHCNIVVSGFGLR
jgi:hypothetical protein